MGRDEGLKRPRCVIEPFSPNLILGVSDEPSPVCDIERDLQRLENVRLLLPDYLFTRT